MEGEQSRDDLPKQVPQESREGYFVEKRGLGEITIYERRWGFERGREPQLEEFFVVELSRDEARELGTRLLDEVGSDD